MTDQTRQRASDQDIAAAGAAVEAVSAMLDALLDSGYEHNGKKIDDVRERFVAGNLAVRTTMDFLNGELPTIAIHAVTSDGEQHLIFDVEFNSGSTPPHLGLVQ